MTSLSAADERDDEDGSDEISIHESKKSESAYNNKTR